ncbi:MAG: histidine--tRNA ligase [Planctomycetota bacterium]|jgi:histidyl-tRNA synthetase|nr:histidine--tRNA ligase [Planctomycetota bacterium]
MAANRFTNPRGTRDLHGDNLVLIKHLEEVAAKVATAAAYTEIRTPMFEETRLFKRSLGEASDVVEKEMFSVPRRGADDLQQGMADGFTFRPEGTASVARAYVQGGFAASAPLQKWYYIGPMFRYERPQKGRERQFTQFGIEAFGAQSPSLDAEVVAVAISFFKELGFDDQLEVRVNSMGDSCDRQKWSASLADFFAPQFEQKNCERCGDCQSRVGKNVFRLLDCKVKRCIELNAGAPDLFSVMGEEALQHHQQFISCLRALGLKVIEDSSIVRGLDYYTRTVFEVHYPPLGSRSALCGGGRYDGLVEEMGGRPTPGVGFSVGFTPTELALAELGLPADDLLKELKQSAAPEVYAVAVSDDQREHLFALCLELRAAGLKVEIDHRGKSLKAQFKEANRSGARWALVLGEDEVANSEVVLKDLSANAEQRLSQSQILTAIREQ